MAIEVNETVVETFTATEASPQTITLSTAVAGDVRVVVMNHSPDGTATIGTVTIPSGWTEMSTNTNTGAASDSKLTMMYRVVQGGDPGTVSVTTSTNMTVGAICVTYEGVDTANVEDATAPSMGTGTGGAVCPAITTVTDNAWVGRAGIVDGTASPIQDADVPASHTLRGAMDNSPPSNGMSLGLADEIQVSFGDAGTATWGNGGSEEYVGATFALRPLVGPVITSVDSDDEVDDKQTGVIVAGSAFEASQGTGVVEIASRADKTIHESHYDESNQDSIRALGQNPGSQILRIAQSFTGKGGVLRKAVFQLRQQASPTGNAVAKLYAHSGTFGTSSVPTGSALATSANVDVTTIGGTLELVEFTFSGSTTLTDGTNYCISVEFTGDTTNYLGLGYDNTSPTHPGNYSEHITGSWAAQSGWDMVFSVLTDPIEQTVTAWGDTSITITVVMGRLNPAIAPTGQRYMFVTNDSDELSPGFPFTLHRAEAFAMAASGNIAASGENTTAQLAAPSGKTTGDFDGGRIQDDENPGDTINVTVDNYREDEWCIEAVDDSEADEQYEFRLIFSDTGAPADTISVTPKWTVTAGVTVTPGAAAATWAAASPTVVAGAVTLTPGAAVGTWAAASPTIAATFTATPAAAVGTWAAASPTIIPGAVNLTPGAAVGIWAAASPTVVAGAVTLTPGASAGTWAAASPTVAATFTATPSAAVGTWAVASPTLTVGGVTLTPSAAVGIWAAASPVVVIGGVTLTPAAAVGAWIATSPTLTVGAVVTPSAAVGTWAAASPVLVAGGVTLTPDAAGATWAVGTPTLVLGAVTATPAVALGTWIAASPTLTVGQNLTPSAAVGTWAVASPTLVAGAVTLTPGAAVGIWAAASPVLVAGGSSLTPTAAVGTWAVAMPTVVVSPLTVNPGVPIAIWAAVSPALIIGGGPTLTPAAAVATWIAPGAVIFIPGTGLIIDEATISATAAEERTITAAVVQVATVSATVVQERNI